MQTKTKILLWVTLASAYLLFCSVKIGLADTLYSSNYQFQESALGGNGLLDSQSANYQATTSGGILGVGNNASSNFQINAGNLTTSDPALAFAITDATADFPDFSSTAASTATATFEVTDYTSYGYVVTVAGNPPTNNSHSISPMSTLGPSQAGQEGFGINLVANTTPANFGSNPICSPDSSFCPSGPLTNMVTSNYNQTGEYYYPSGGSDTVVSSPKSSGKISYTVSYITNVNSLTPGGHYTSNQTLIVTGTY